MRGQDSFKVILTAIQNDIDKFVDFCVLSKKIRACTSWKKWEETTEYKKIVSEHDEWVSHFGLAVSIEANGVV